MRTLLAVLALCFAAPVHAGCVTPEKVTADLASGYPGVMVRVVQDPERWMKAFNAEPPVSNAKADQVLIYSHPMQPTFFAVFIVKGCMSSFSKVHPSTMKKIESAVTGEAI